MAPEWLLFCPELRSPGTFWGMSARHQTWEWWQRGAGLQPGGRDASRGRHGAAQGRQSLQQHGSCRSNAASCCCSRVLQQGPASSEVVDSVDALVVALQREVGGRLPYAPHLLGTARRHALRSPGVAGPPVHLGHLAQALSEQGLVLSTPVSCCMLCCCESARLQQPAGGRGATFTVLSREALANVFVSLGLKMTCMDPGQPQHSSQAAGTVQGEAAKPGTGLHDVVGMALKDLCAAPTLHVSRRGENSAHELGDGSNLAEQASAGEAKARLLQAPLQASTRPYLVPVPKLDEHVIR